MNQVFFNTRRLPPPGGSGPGCVAISRMASSQLELRSFWGSQFLFRGLLAITFLLAGFSLAPAAGPGEVLDFSPDRPGQEQTTQSHRLAHSLAHPLRGAVLNVGAFDPQGRRPPFFRTVELRYQSPYGGRESQVELGLMFSLLENQQGALYMQGSGLYRSGELGANIGLGYRLDLVQGLQVGANVFYDWLDTPETQRASGGLEAKTGLLDISANFYDALDSEDRSADEKNVFHGLDGWDIQCAAACRGSPGWKLKPPLPMGPAIRRAGSGRKRVQIAVQAHPAVPDPVELRHPGKLPRGLGSEFRPAVRIRTLLEGAPSHRRCPPGLAGLALKTL